MTRKHLLTAAAIYYGTAIIWFAAGNGPNANGLSLNAITLFYMLTFFPIAPAVLLGLLYGIRQREAAARQHQFNLDMQDRLARQIVKEMNGETPVSNGVVMPRGQGARP